MKRCGVEFSDQAETDLIESIIWGIGVWGEEATFRWARELRGEVRNRLCTFPLGTSLAPESDLDGETRHLIIGRYRVLFEVAEQIVNILHITGSFSDEG